ncbi:MAG: hypothetical protein VB034_10350 [Eubacteriales bacterium]|nr:hypothetical protein [Eubacteriales bacterium]
MKKNTRTAGIGIVAAIALICAGIACVVWIRQAQETTSLPPSAAIALPSPTPQGAYRECIARYYDYDGTLERIAVSNASGAPLWEETEEERKGYTYDAWGNLLSSSRYTGREKTLVQKVEYRYDAQGRLLNQSSFGYEDGETIAGQQDVYEYDGHGNRTFYEHRLDDGSVEKSETNTYRYDGQGRVVKQICIQTEEGIGTLTTTTKNSYDKNGNLICRYETKETKSIYLSSGKLKTLYEYDARNRCIKETVYRNGYADGYYTYEYDENNVCRKVVWHQPIGEEIVVEEYDERGEPVPPGLFDVSNTYNTDGVLTYSTESYYCNYIRRTDYQYDGNGLLIREEYTKVDTLGAEAPFLLGYCEYEYTSD